jgi:hypothetical protein
MHPTTIHATNLQNLFLRFIGANTSSRELKLSPECGDNRRRISYGEITRQAESQLLDTNRFRKVLPTRRGLGRGALTVSLNA